jgi:hypothetical protein
MRRTLLVALTAFVVSPLVEPLSADTRLLGPWRAVTYTIAGKDYPMQGVFIFTPKYYSGVVRFRFSSSTIDDANGNSGPYRVDGNAIVFSQTVQLHLRPGDSKEPMLAHEGPDERATYTVDANRLVLTFPSGNRYLLERLSDR